MSDPQPVMTHSISTLAPPLPDGPPSGGSCSEFTSGPTSASPPAWWRGRARGGALAVALAVLMLLVVPQVAKADSYPTWTAGSATSASFAFPNGVNGTITLVPNAACTNPSALGAVQSIANGSLPNYPNAFYTPTPPDPTQYLVVGVLGTCANTVRGRVTITFNQPVVNPRMHLINLDAAEYHFVGSTPTRLSGNPEFEVVGNIVNATPHDANGDGCALVANGVPPAGCGTIQFDGAVTELVWDMTDFTPTTGGGDGHYLTLSLPADYGDAPASYDAGTPAHHLISALRLGTNVDADAGPQPTANADGDDTNGIDDEDGVHFNTDVSVPGREETVFVTASAAGFLNAWIDFDRNGTFDASEQIFNDQAVAAGQNTLRYTVPTGAAFVPGPSYARFRLTSGQGQANSPTGLAPDGEVEDYTRMLFDAPAVALGLCPAGTVPVPTSIIQNPSFESRTACFTNTAANSINFATNWFDNHPTGGQYHVFDAPTCDSGPANTTNAGMPMRAGADGVGFMGGHSVATSRGEGATNTLLTPLIPNATYVGFFSMFTGGYSRQGNGRMNFYGVNDLNAGSINNPPLSAANSEQLYQTPVVNWYGGGANLPTWQLITYTLTASQAWPFLRVEVRNANPAADGTTAGQTWVNFDDFHMYLCNPIDWGDAPDSYGTTSANNGANHLVSPSLFLGAVLPDGEADGQPTVGADGDDNNGSDDEDAFGAMPPMATTQTGYTVTFPVRNTTGGDASVVGWVDWNQNGVFDPDEGVASMIPDNATTATLTWSGVSGLTGGNTYARFRIAAPGEIDTNTPTGPAPRGEVEDYIFPLAVPPDDIFQSCPISTEPPPTDFTIRERWRTPGTQALVYQTPLVGDLDGDGLPEVVVGANVNYAAGLGTGAPATGRLVQDLRIYRGSDGTLLNTITTPYYSWSGNAAHALADVDGDGQAEILFKVAGHTAPAAVQGRLIAYRNDGTILWTSDQRYDYGESRGGFSLNLADFNGDGIPEVYVGNQIFNAQTGARLAALNANASSGCPSRHPGNNCFWGNSVAVDMDGDGQLELVAGNVVYKVNLVNLTGEAGNSLTVWRQADPTVPLVGDGLTAVADIDLDGDPDVVVVRTHNNDVNGNAVMYVWDGQTSTVMGITPQLNPNGSQPFIGDIDGDGAPEIVFVTALRLRAYDYVPGVGLQVKWTLVTTDGSGYTTLTMFDFNNDGVTELVYRDEDNIRIIDGSGATAVNRASFACTSNTGTEMPVVADIDGSGMAQILVTCGDADGIQGDVRAFTTNSFPWANARPVWNQQAYYVAHINNDLTVPADQFPHWTSFSDPAQLCSNGTNRPLNAFLQQVTDLDATTGCPVNCESGDFGDAPDTYGTLIASDGPRHRVPGYNSSTNTAPLMLGATIDLETDGQPTPGADGDDLTDSDDEDGVALPAVLAPGQLVTLPVTVTGSGGLLNAWIDWNGNGVFDPAEQIATDLAVVAGVNNLPVTVPADAALGITYARFRLSTQAGLGPTGFAIDGEVEDYVLTIAIPSLSATKRAALQSDADGDGFASPGDTLRYTIQIVNGGSGPALGVVYTDLPDLNTALAVGSVTTSQGTVTTGNNGGDTTVAVSIGDIPGGGVVTIVYEVTINNPVAAWVTQVANQGIVDPQNPDIPDTLTDDPDTPTPGDPTIVPIVAAPVVKSYKTATLAVDADGDGVPSPGDTLLYTIQIRNSGNQDAPAVVLNDLLDANTTLNVGSVTTDLGTVTAGNSAGDTHVEVAVGALPGGGAQATITYQVTIHNPLPAGVTKVSNQGIVSSPDPRIPDLLTDCTDTPIPDDPCDVPVVAAPVVKSYKSATLAVDADGDGVPSPGDTLLYTIQIINSGNQDAPDISFSDSPDPNTTLLVGTVASDRGAITSGNSAGQTSVAVAVGTLSGGGGAANISYRVTINNPLPGGVTKVSNQGIISSPDPNVPEVLTDCTDTPIPDDPCDVPVVSAPMVKSYKTATLVVDADGDGVPSPGDTLLYTIQIVNSGNQDAPDISFSDSPDPNSTLSVGSVASDRGAITSGNNAGDSNVAVAVGTLPGGGGQATISYRVTINNPLPAGVTKVSNQGIVSSPDPRIPDLLTDCTDTPVLDDPCDVTVVSKPLLKAYKKATLVVDADGNGRPSPGDTLLYTIQIINSGNAAAPGLTFTDYPDPHTSLVVGSVGTSLGTITRGNNAGDTSVFIDIGTLPGGGAQVEVSFRATIANPLPAGVTQVSNQGIVSSSDPEIPDVPTDDPEDPTPDDPTDVVIEAKPVIDAFKKATLFSDADGNGYPSPGDTLLYTIQIFNHGNQAAPGVVFTDIPDANTSLVVGSVGASLGTISRGNSAGDTSIEVTIGTLPGGGQVEIAYRVTIANPLPAGVTKVLNQGVVTSSDPTLPAVPTDDPTTPTPEDPTEVWLTAEPLLRATKADLLFVDADGNGVPSPGDTLLYNITVVNIGNGAATGMRFTDTPDANTTLVAGSVSSNRGSVSSGNNSGDTSIAVEVGVLPANETLEISYRVTVHNPLPPGVTQVSNQGLVHSDNDANPCPGVLQAAEVRCPQLPTDNPSTLTPHDPTVTPLLALPDLVATKRDTLVVDVGGDLTVSPGDTLLYTVLLRNQGNVAATGVVFTDQPDANTTLVVGSVQSSAGTVTSGNSSGDTSIRVEIGTLAANSQVEVSYRVVVHNPFPAGVTQVSNQGLLASNELPDLLTDDPDTLEPQDRTVTQVISGGAPKAVTLVRFTATWQGDHLLVEWESSAERNVFGFQLYRSATDQRGEAVLVTPELIASQGDSGGVYQVIDRGVTPGGVYTYWLVEVALNGETSDAASITVVAGSDRLFLPLVSR